MHFNSWALLLCIASVATPAPLDRRQDDVVVVTVTVWDPPAPTPDNTVQTGPAQGDQGQTDQASPPSFPPPSTPAPSGQPTFDKPPSAKAISGKATSTKATPSSQLPVWTRAQGPCEKWTGDFTESPVQCGVSWIDTVNQFRKAYNLPVVRWDAKAAAESWTHLQMSHGGPEETHFGNTDGGNWYEVITPGYAVPPPGADLKGLTPFGAAMVDWLCERPNDAQLQATGFMGVNACPDIAHAVDRMDYSKIDLTPGKNHHDALLVPEISIFGCAYMDQETTPIGPEFTGQYICNFA